MEEASGRHFTPEEWPLVTSLGPTDMMIFRQWKKELHGELLLKLQETETREEEQQTRTRCRAVTVLYFRGNNIFFCTIFNNHLQQKPSNRLNTQNLNCRQSVNAPSCWSELQGENIQGENSNINVFISNIKHKDQSEENIKSNCKHIWCVYWFIIDWLIDWLLSRVQEEQFIQFELKRL